MLATASLELKAGGQSAHSGDIDSVAFSPDGTTIVSGSNDRTIKVWDAVNFSPHVESEWEQFDKTVRQDRYQEYDYDSDEENEVEEWWRNKVTGLEQATKPSGGAPLGHYSIGTIKSLGCRRVGTDTPDLLAKPDCSCACGSIIGAQGGEAERAQ